MNTFSPGSMNYLLKILQLFSIVTVRYLVFAGIGYLIFYSWKKGKFLYKKIQASFPDPGKIKIEFWYSILTSVIFAFTGLLVVILNNRGYILLYTDIHLYGWFYFFTSIILMLLIHDTYFYWTHRLMHWKKIFPYVHKVHHYSNNPTPWAAFSFHPVEAVIEAGILPLIVFIMPVHTLAIFIFLLIMTIMNVMGHLGFELYHPGFVRHWLGKWNNTSTHHNMHHRLVKCNYGLYFNIWDRLMKTNHADYFKEFEKVATKKEVEKQVVFQQNLTL